MHDEILWLHSEPITSRQRWARFGKKSVDLSDTDTLLLGERIAKAIVSLQIPEFFSDEAIQVCTSMQKI